MSLNMDDTVSSEGLIECRPDLERAIRNPCVDAASAGESIALRLGIIVLRKASVPYLVRILDPHPKISIEIFTDEGRKLLHVVVGRLMRHVYPEIGSGRIREE